MQLRCDQENIPIPANSSLDDLTHEKWYLVAPTESSDLFPVNRATNLVHAPNGRIIPFSTFLVEFFPAGTYLDAQIVHMPEQFVQPDEMLPLATRSCAGSVSLASTETGRFQPRRRVLGDVERAKTREKKDNEKMGMFLFDG